MHNILVKSRFGIALLSINGKAKLNTIGGMGDRSQKWTLKYSSNIADMKPKL